MKNLSLYKINKRINSTLLPTAEQLIGTMGVALKNATSIDTPTFVIAVGAADIDAIWSANYAEYEGSYYWINDITQINNTHVELQCRKDSLATYKDYIKATKAYVLLSSSAGRTDIIDNRNVKTIEWECLTGTGTEKGSKLFNLDSTGWGTYVFQVISNGSTKGTTTKVYLLSENEMDSLMNTLYSDANFFEDFIKYVGNPGNFMVRCTWFPFNKSTFQFSTSPKTMVIGNYEVSDRQFDCLTYYNPKVTSDEVWIDISSYLNNTYAYDESNITVKCHLPYIGIIDLPSNILLKYSNTKIYTFHITLDIYTGALCYQIRIPKNENETDIIAEYRTQMGAEVPVGASTYNPLGPIGTAVASGAQAGLMGLMTGGAGLIPGLLSGSGQIINSLSSLQRHNGMTGSIGSRLDTSVDLNKITIHIYKQQLAESVTAKKDVLGLPLCSTVELSTLTGYVQCANASVSAPAMESEIREINNFLNGGVYLE